MRPVLEPLLDLNIIRFSEVDSTNDAAARLVAVWADDEDERLQDTLIVAARQTAGRGRNSHAWESPAGGLYATWLGWIPAGALAWLPIAAGVSLVEAVDRVLPGAGLGLKWPNDLLAGGAKLAGILCQSRIRGDHAWAAVGLGVNVAVAPELPAGSNGGAVSLRSLGFSGPAEDAIVTIAGAFARRLRGALEDPDELRAAWLARTAHRPGDPLRIRVGEEVVIGGFVGLAEGGHLELDVAGQVRRFAAGELVGALDAPPGSEG